MPIRHSEHFARRMSLRDIPAGIPILVFTEADARYFDVETGLNVAVKRILFLGRDRDVALTYRGHQDDILFITIHPLQQGQKERRVRNGRWQPV